MTKLNEESLTDLNLLLSVEGIGPGKIHSLLARFKTVDNIFSSGYNQLIKTPGINKNLAGRILKSCSTRSKIRDITLRELDRLRKMNAYVATVWDEEYPDLLKKIYAPPLLLFCKGIMHKRDEFPIAVVGTRQPTGYGRIQTEKLTAELAAQKITIVSGLARGIDSITHSAALKNSARTIAVIGSGLDVIYPPENKKLFDEIFENGLIISEYELGTKPNAENFPKRNRIISGLSLGCVIIETGIAGGAMQTASFALDQNREVFAVPGNLGIKQSEGTNLLIQRGEAKLIRNSEDVLLELELKLKPIIGKNIPKPKIEMNLFEEKIISVLKNEPVQIDIIAASTNLTTSDCLVHLLSLEFKGLVKQLPGKMFALL